jgi:hypothetical protein
VEANFAVKEIFMAAKNYGADIASEYQRYLGRAPQQDELDFFTQALKNKDISPFEIGMFLQGHPEAQQARLRQYGQQYSDMLGANDQQILNKAADTARGQFAQLGRPISSGLGSQILSAGQDLAQNRQQALAQFYGTGFGNLQNQYQTGGEGALQRQYGLADRRHEEAQQLSNFYLNKDASMGLLNMQNSAGLRNALWGAGLTALGQGAGGFFGGAGFAKMVG